MPLEDIKQSRLDKLNKLRKAGVDPYPAVSGRTHTISETLADFETRAANHDAMTLAGRVMAIREHGGSTFMDIIDGSGRLQIFFKKDNLGDKKYSFLLETIDIGDFIEATGTAFRTKKNEPTIEISEYKMLAKSLLPLPEKWHGIEDEEEKLRKRYLDILFNPETKEMFKKRAKFWQSARDFLIKKGFMEVETPVLENVAGGADAKPFITHHNALDMDVYLRISMGELWQKRLMVAGFEKTFELGRQFRNEGMDSEHLQDYTQLEFYLAYADYKIGMKLVEDLYKHMADETFGALKFKIKDFDIDLGKTWEIYDYRGVIMEKTGIDVLKTNEKQIEEKLKELNIKYDKKGFNITRAMDNLWKYCRKQITGPGFLTGAPIEVSPLAKRDTINPDLSQRFQVIIAGSELGNGYSELNDPLDQAARFKEQAKLREAGDEEAQMFDHDFVEALEYGMPPTCGFGVSERLFSFLMNKSARECQIFPLMKPKEENKK